MTENQGFNSLGNGTAELSNRVRELQLTGRMEGDKKVGKGPNWLPWILCVFLAFGWGGYAIKAFRQTKTKDDVGDALNAPGGAKGVAATGPGARKTDPNRDDTGADGVALEVKGYLIPTQQISISPIDVAGRIVKLNIEEGMSFDRNAVLAEIDKTPFEAQMAEFTAAMAAAKARLQELEAGSRPQEIEQAQADLDEAKTALVQFAREWQRFESQKTAAITTREYEQAEANYRAAVKRVESRQKALELITAGPRKERIDVARAEYEVARARHRQAEWKLENCTIKSPVTGVILTKKAEVGSLINPVVGGVSTSLCEIADLRKLEVDLEVQERDISRVKLDQYCKIKADAWPNRDYEGYVERMMPIANRSKSVVPIRIKVIPRTDEQQGQYLKPEMSVTVTFFKRTVTPAEKAAAKRLQGDEK